LKEVFFVEKRCETSEELERSKWSLFIRLVTLEKWKKIPWKEKKENTHFKVFTEIIGSPENSFLIKMLGRSGQTDRLKLKKNRKFNNKGTEKKLTQAPCVKGLLIRK
jgi:hypothetical protein